MYIQPNTEVIILSGVPLDNTYNHTLYFANKTQQENTFKTFIATIPTDTGNIPATLDKLSYQRINSNVMKVAFKADNIYNCNYMMFKNTSYSDKWYYAFINSVEYINENSSQINYTLDVIQTYYFDYEFGDCLIQRQHATTDVIGDNIIPENLDTGDMTVVNRKELSNSFVTGTKSNLSDQYGILIHSTYPLVYYMDGTRHEFNGTIDDKYVLMHKDFNNIIGCGLYYIDISKFMGTDPVGPTLFDALARGGKAESILYITLVKRSWVAPYFDTVFSDTINFYEILSRNSEFTATFNEQYTFAIESTTDYEPIYRLPVRNMKVYTYPFTYVQLADNNGSNKIYKNELFQNITNNNNTITFYGEYSGAYPNQPLLLYPINYNNINFNYQEGMTTELTSLCLYSFNTFANWYAQHQNSIQMSKMQQYLHLGLDVATTAILLPVAPVMAGIKATKGAISAAEDIFKLNSELADKRKLPLTTNNVTGTNITNLTYRHSGVWAETIKLRDEYLQKIDMYFTMFGYAQNKVGKPNIHARESFTYIKTANCIIHPKQDTTGKNLPSFTCDVENQISDIFNNGITFWVNPSQVGDYSVNNAIIGGTI